MSTSTTDDAKQDNDYIEDLNMEFLNILSELSQIVSMEDNYLSAGAKMKNRSALTELMERMNTLQVKIDEEAKSIQS